MRNDPEMTLSPAEVRDLRCVAGMMVPASEEFGVPGADDAAIFADIIASIGRDFDSVRQALGALAALSSGQAFADLDETRRDMVAGAFQAQGGVVLATLTRVILQCYYRDDRVVRSLGLEPRPPFPKGHTLEQGDWSLLDPVRTRPKMWRDVPPR
ncbi:MAG: hypothetical protein JWQ55_2608 [Rhodopila sp.]|jgi:hypothetical protein|nr:hypothetical protein [Rhodopila sp.]